MLLKSKIRLPILFSAMLVFTSGCGTPFSLRLGTYNELSPQRPASIVISDPQIYARETLVNDRLNEKKLLENLLKESSFIGKTSDEKDFRKQFTPQFKRDLTTLQSFIADLGLEFDPLGGKQIKRTESLADLKGQKEEFEAKTELEKARQKYEKALLGEFEEDVPPVTDTSDGAAQPTQDGETPSQTVTGQPNQQQNNTAQTPDPALAEIKTLVATFNKKLETLIGALKKDKITGSTTEPDPRDVFRDLLAYRSELRQALAAINLDDLHDYAGNALYRLQFRASLMPGENKNKLGVARLTFERPRISEAEIAKLYYTWVTHTTRRMNRNPKLLQSETITSDPRIERLEVGGLFRVVKIVGSPGNTDSNMEELLFQVGVHPEYYPVIYEATRDWREYGENGYPTISLKELQDDLSRKYSKATRFYDQNNKAIPRGTIQEEQARYTKQLERFKSNLRADLKFFAPEQNVTNEQIAQIAYREACKRKFALDHFRSAIMGYEDSDPTSGESINDVSDAVSRLSSGINGELQFYYTLIAKTLANKNPQYSFGFESINRSCKLAIEKNPAFDVPFVDGQLAAPTPFASSLLHMEQVSPPLPPGRYFGVNDYCAVGDIRCLAVSRRDAAAGFDGDYSVNPLPRPDIDRRSLEIRTDDLKIKRKTKKVTNHHEQSNGSVRKGDGPNFEVQGHAYAYTVQPLELSQRLSTSARNTNSLELALSAVATLKQLGTKANLDTKYIRQSSGNIEALERTPIVVGFAERESEIERDIQPRRRRIRPSQVSGKLNEYQNPQVGWVFGPPLQIDGSEGSLNYVQSPTAYEVSADLSLPGWWPSVRARLETAWIGNWNSIGQPIRVDQRGQGYHLEKFNIRLPVNQADLDALTNFVANQTVGQSAQFVSLDSVRPYAISACTDTVELLIRGANVWRSTEVYLGGVMAGDVRVLPDMQGIAAKFDLDELFKTRNKSKEGNGLNREYVDLSIQTRDGSIDTQVLIIGERYKENGVSKSQCSSSQTFSSHSVNADNTLQLTNVSPTKIQSCAKSASFAISLDKNDGGNIINKFDTKAFFNGEQGSVEAFSKSIYIARFNGPFDKSKITQGELTIVTDAGFTRAPVPIVACKAENKDKALKISLSPARAYGIYSISAAKKLTTTLLFTEKSRKTPPNNTRIGLRPTAKGYSGVLEQSDGPLVANVTAGLPQKASFSINLASNSAFAAHVSSGRIYETKYVEYDSDGSSKTSPIAGNIVLYTAGKEKAEITKDKQSNSFNEFDVTLELPVNHQIGFPKARSATLIVRTSSVPSFPFVATQKSLSGTTAVFTVKLKIVDPSKEAAEIKALADYLSDPKKFIRLQFEFSGVLGEEVPEIVIKKSTSGTQTYLTLQK